jgi:nucleotide-binding universal stress UspA family protein
MSAPDGPGAVVVGVDGSPESRAALVYALDDAARRGARLRVVAALARPDYWVTAYGPVPLPPSSEDVERVRAAARLWIDDVTADRPRDAVPIEVSAVPGPAAEALITASRDADLLVLGHRRRGAVAGMLLGSVGMRCVVDAPCPVTVVPPPVVTLAAAHRPSPAERPTRCDDGSRTHVQARRHRRARHHGGQGDA